MNEHELTEAGSRGLKTLGYDKLADQFRTAAGPALAAARNLRAQRKVAFDAASEPAHVFRPGEPEPRR
jgi:hypothetical protein